MTTIEKIQSFSLNSECEVLEFANYLVNDLGLSFYDSETYKITDFWGLRVKRIPFFKNDSRYNILYDLGLLEQPNLKILRKQIKRSVDICESFYANRSFAEMLCSLTEEKDNYEPYQISSEEEAEECNREFYSMMDDFEAWGNIE